MLGLSCSPQKVGCALLSHPTALPTDFPEGTDVEVIVLPLPSAQAAQPDADTAEWLRGLWACAPDFPDRLPDPPPAPVEIP